MPRPNTGLISVDRAWQAVSLEERIELISRAHATGLLASMTSMLLIGAIAYGFDKIWLLAAGVASSMFVFPLFSSYSWRREKPALILAYLAVRAISRRYAYGYAIPDIDIVFIYRSTIRELYRDAEEEMLHKQRDAIDLEFPGRRQKDVWVVLMRGGIVIMSERLGGAHLEFLTQINHEIVVRKPTEKESSNRRALVIEGVLASKGRTIVLEGKYPAAEYVFEKKLFALVDEWKNAKDTLEKLRSNLPKNRLEE